MEKSIAVSAGLGGGSSNAATALAAWADLTGGEASLEAAAGIGADVAFFLKGGLQWMEGYGERLTNSKERPELAVAVVVPPFELATRDVYQRWDRLGEPKGPSLDGRQLPPSLRGLGPFRNDLTPAAVDLRPELGDFIEDLSQRWGQPVMMTGSGPALFTWLSDVGEAESAVDAAPRRVPLSPRRSSPTISGWIESSNSLLVNGGWSLLQHSDDADRPVEGLARRGSEPSPRQRVSRRFRRRFRRERSAPLTPKL